MMMRWIKIFGAALLLQFAAACINKGDTRVKRQETDEESKGNSLCVKYCDRVDEAGCSSHRNCEANCTSNAELCPSEVDEAIRCFIDDENPTECDSRGYATTPGCEDEAFAMGECLWLGGTEGVEDVAQCTALNSGCHSCCEDAFPGGADEWNDVVEACACSDSCASSCDGVCGDPEAVITEACSACVVDCVQDNCVLGDGECGAYSHCTSLCPPEPTVTQPEPGADPQLPDDPAPEPEPSAEPEPSELPPSPNAGVAVRRWAEVQCAKEMSCNFLLTNIVAGDLEYCTDRVEEELEWAMGLPGSGIAAKTADECAQQITDYSCDDWHQPDAECVVEGDLEDGDPCSHNAQCQSAWCQSARFSCGTCQPKPEEGDPCTHWSECPGGDCRDGRCVPLGLEGQACDDESPCHGSFLTCVAGVCEQSDRQLGESCGPDLDLPFCDQVSANLVCNGGECVEATVAKAGEGCPAVGWCEGLGTCVEGTCVAGPDVGEACSDETGPFCRWPTICQNGVCQGIPDDYTCDDEAASGPMEPEAAARQRQ